MELQSSRSTQGYSILELVTVIAVLSTLASLTLPSVLRIFDFNNIDEIKTLLNTAAADCLQQSRLKPNKITHTETIDENKINALGYSLDSSSKPEQGSGDTGAKCSFLLLNSTNNSDTIRYSIGFSVFEGELTKFANRPSADEAGIQSCENWAGDNCSTNSSEAQKTTANSKITNAIARQTCEADYETWTPTATGKSEYNRWNSDTNSCTKTIYAYNGKIVGYDKCSQQLAKAKEDGTTTTDSNGEQFPTDCPGQTFWLYEGTDLGSYEAFKRHESKAKETDCEMRREAAREGTNQCYLPQEGPGSCGKTTYVYGKSFVELNYYLEKNNVSTYSELECINLPNI